MTEVRQTGRDPIATETPIGRKKVAVGGKATFEGTGTGPRMKHQMEYESQSETGDAVLDRAHEIAESAVGLDHHQQRSEDQDHARL